MSLTLQALENAFSTIESVGKGELAFEVAGTPVVFRIVPPEEEAYIHKQANLSIKSADPEDEANQYRALTYINEIKLGIISHALIEIDGLDLRDTPFVETGEKLSNGKAVKIARAEAIRKIIRQREWSGTLQTMMFRKYGELLQQVDSEAEKAIAFEPSDRSAEIDRLKKRLLQLEEQDKADQAENEKSLGTEFTQQVRSIVALEDQESQHKQDQMSRLAAGDTAVALAQKEVKSDDEAVKVDAGQVMPVRRPIIPQRAAPPASPASQSFPVMPSVTKTPATPVEVPAAPPVGDNSFIDTSDPDAMQAAVDAENHRLMASRMGAPVAQPESALMRGRAMRRPPHLDALETDTNYMGNQTVVGTVSSPVKAPVEELVRANSAPVVPASVNVPVRGGMNPRFKPAGR